MDDASDPMENDHAARIESALAESQRLEREEREADLAKQSSADERIVSALAAESPEQSEQ